MNDYLKRPMTEEEENMPFAKADKSAGKPVLSAIFMQTLAETEKSSIPLGRIATAT